MIDSLIDYLTAWMRTLWCWLLGHPGLVSTTTLDTVVPWYRWRCVQCDRFFMTTNVLTYRDQPTIGGNRWTS